MYQQQQVWELQSPNQGSPYDVPSFNAADQFQPTPYHQDPQFGHRHTQPPQPRPLSCWDPPWYHVQQEYRSYVQESPTGWPSTCWDLPRQHTPQHPHQDLIQPSYGYETAPTCDLDPYRRQRSPPDWPPPPPQRSPSSWYPPNHQRTTTAINCGGKESLYGPNDFWDSSKYEDDVNSGYSEETWFLGHEIDYQSDTVKGKGHGSTPPSETPEVGPNLSVAALVSQLERLTADVEQLVSQMDAQERRLGDPHTEFSIPYTAPVSCPLPQPTIAAPAVLHHAPHHISTSDVTPNSLQPHTLGEQYACHPQPPTLGMSHSTDLLPYSAAPYVVQLHVNPDITGSLQQPPVQSSPPCSHDIRYGSIDSLANDIDEHESVQSQQIHYDNIVSDQLLNRDPIGDEETKDVIHSSVDVSGPIYGSQDDIYDSCNVVFARQEPIHVVEHNRVDITMLSNKIDSFLLKEDEDGSIEEVKKVIACVYVVWHVGDVLGINHRSTFLNADARVIPLCDGFIDCSATPLPDTAGARRAHIDCQKVDDASLENIASLTPSRLSAKHGSCAFDPGGSTSQYFVRDWKKIEAYVLWVLPQVNIIGVDPFDANAKALLLHLDRRLELDQAGGFVDGKAVMEIDKETFSLCSMDLTEGMGLVSHSAICISLNDMFEEIRTIFKLFLSRAESFCKYYSLKDANVVVVTSGADMNFSRLGLIIAPEDAVQLYLQLTSPRMETRQHQELLEVFHDNLISELHWLLVSWFPP